MVKYVKLPLNYHLLVCFTVFSVDQKDEDMTMRVFENGLVFICQWHGTISELVTCASLDII